MKKTWLEVRVRASHATGLLADDVFYFGNAVGETGNSTTDARVTSADALRVPGNVSASAPVANRYDVNRDGKVGAADRLLVLGKPSAIEPLVLLDLTGGAVLAGETPAAAEQAPPAEWSESSSGIPVQWIGDGRPVRIWTSEALIGAGWELYDEVGEGRPGGDVLEVLLPIDTEGAARFYRLEASAGR